MATSPPDVLAPSVLANPDLLPTRPEQRTWSTWHIAALWVGMAVCIPTYQLAGGMISQGMNWWQATLTVALGNLIVLIPLILNGHPGVKYGIPFPVLMRASFGTRGANIPAVLRALVACGWFGIQVWVGGKGIYTMLGALGWIDLTADAANITWLGITNWQLLCFFIFWLINVYFIVRGMDSIKWMESLSAPVLILGGLALMVWAMVRAADHPGGVSAVFRAETNFAPGTTFWTVFVPQLTAMVGFWSTLSLNIPDFTRYARSQKSQAWGQALGMPTTMTLFCFIGIIVTAATPVVFAGTVLNDPVEVVSRIGSGWVIVLSLIVVSLATLSTNIAANVVSPANDFSNLSPRRISFRTGGLITAGLGVVILPWKLDAAGYVYAWLIGYSALLGPIAGIMLADYYIIRRTVLNVNALYDPAGEYTYTRGINRRAVAALLIAVVPNVPGFINYVSGTARFPVFFDTIYSFAWFNGLVVGGAVYWVLMRAKRPGRET